jgi:hypothetical protein
MSKHPKPVIPLDREYGSLKIDFTIWRRPIESEADSDPDMELTWADEKYVYSAEVPSFHVYDVHWEIPLPLREQIVSEFFPYMGPSLIEDGTIDYVRPTRTRASGSVKRA